jgi:peptidoglycan/xylan/chitin deacetylase (PgdA/CDA1 family)
MTLVAEKPTSAASTTTERAPLRVPRGPVRRRTLRKTAGLAVATLFSELCGPREAHAFGILMYHRIVDPVPRKPRPTWNVPPARFEKQLTGLLRRGWEAWPLKQVLEYIERDLPLPRKTFVVTFDDGYVNNLTQAAPILTRLGVPATLFLATAYLDSKEPFPSDDWSAAGQPGVPTEAWRPLTTEECHRLAANGLVELGAHTHTHADFRGRPVEFATDLAENLRVLRTEFGVDRPTFAFPYGTVSTGFASPELAGVARKLGLVCALNTESAIVRRGDSPFAWGRFTAEEQDSARSLAAQLGGWYEAVRNLSRRRGTLSR